VDLLEGRPKNLKDMVEIDPLDKLKWIVDPAIMLSEIARQVDNINRQIGQGRAFIEGEERPPVGMQPTLRNPMLERTPPPSPEELARMELHGHEPGNMPTRKPDHDHMDDDLQQRDKGSEPSQKKRISHRKPKGRQGDQTNK
jgi:hypothetical protein